MNDHITSDQAAAIAGVARRTWSAYVAREQAPQPVSPRRSHAAADRGRGRHINRELADRRRRDQLDADISAVWNASAASAIHSIATVF